MEVFDAILSLTASPFALLASSRNKRLMLPASPFTDGPGKKNLRKPSTLKWVRLCYFIAVYVAYCCADDFWLCAFAQSARVGHRHADAHVGGGGPSA